MAGQAGMGGMSPEMLQNMNPGELNRAMAQAQRRGGTGQPPQGGMAQPPQGGMPFQPMQPTMGQPGQPPHGGMQPGMQFQPMQPTMGQPGQPPQGGMPPGMGQQQGLTPWGRMSSAMGGPQQAMGNALNRFSQVYAEPGIAGGMAPPPQGGMPFQPMQPTMGQPGQPPQGGMPYMNPGELNRAMAQAQRQGGMGQQQGLTPWGQMSSAMGGPGGMAQQPQGQMGALGGLTGGCPPWMPGCRGGGGGYGGGFAASMPMHGGSRPGLQAQQPARQVPPPPPPSPGGTNVGYSDAKLKQDVEPLEDGLELVNKLDPVRFNWIGSDAQTTGMIAQQVEEVLPGAVIDMGEGYKGIDGLAVIGALVGAIKTLTTRLETLEAR